MLENEPLPSIRKRRRLLLGLGCGLGVIASVVIWIGTASHAWHWSPWNVAFPHYPTPESIRFPARPESSAGREAATADLDGGRKANQESAASGLPDMEEARVDQAAKAQAAIEPLRLERFPAVRSNAPILHTSVRVAAVDFRRVFDSHPRTTLEAARIKQRRDEARAEIMKLQANGDDEMAFEYQERLHKDIERDSGQSRREIVQTIQQILTDCVATRGFDLVFDSSGSTLNGPFLLAAPAATDLTDEVISAVNREPVARQRAKVP